MAIAKKIIESKPDGATDEEILRERTLERMVERGLVDSREGRVLSNEEMKPVSVRGRDRMDH